MTLSLSPTLIAARNQAARNPANAALLAALVSPDGIARSTIALYATTRPAAGEAAGGAALVTMSFSASAGALDEIHHSIVIDTPISAQVTGAEAGGSIPLWGRISDPLGAWAIDCDVSVEGGGGEIQLAATGQEGEPLTDVVRLYQGTFAELTSLILEG